MKFHHTHSIPDIFSEINISFLIIKKNDNSGGFDKIINLVSNLVNIFFLSIKTCTTLFNSASLGKIRSLVDKLVKLYYFFLIKQNRICNYD